MISSSFGHTLQGTPTIARNSAVSHGFRYETDIRNAETTLSVEITVKYHIVCFFFFLTLPKTCILKSDLLERLTENLESSAIFHNRSFEFPVGDESRTSRIRAQKMLCSK